MWQAHRFRQIQIQITNTNKDMRRARIAIVEEHQYCPEDDDGSLPNRLKGNGLAVI
jgi:hypothetical protein